MIWSKASKSSGLSSDPSSPLTSPLGQCTRCGSELVERPLRPFPVAAQVAFGVSFILFLFFSDVIKRSFGNLGLWAWSALQVFLAVVLIRQRMQAKKTVYHCIRCSITVR